MKNKKRYAIILVVMLILGLAVAFVLSKTNTNDNIPNDQLIYGNPDDYGLRRDFPWSMSLDAASDIEQLRLLLQGDDNELFSFLAERGHGMNTNATRGDVIHFLNMTHIAYSPYNIYWTYLTYDYRRNEFNYIYVLDDDYAYVIIVSTVADSFQTSLDDFTERGWLANNITDELPLLSQQGIQSYQIHDPESQSNHPWFIMNVNGYQILITMDNSDEGAAFEILANLEFARGVL